MKIRHKTVLHSVIGTIVLSMPVVSFLLLGLNSTARADAINTTDFVITVKTNNAGVSSPNQFRIPSAGGGYNYTLDCDNDGAPETTGNSGSAVCTYGTPGVYTIRIGGAFPRFFFNNGGDKLKLLSVDQWGTGKWSSMERAFYGAANMDVKAVDVPKFATGMPIDTQHMFRDAKSLVGSGANWNWDTSQFRYASSMFNGAEKFNQNIGGWDMANATQMGNMFNNAKAFNNGGSDSIKNWNVSKVQFMDNMFSGATSFNQPIGSWNTSSVIGMRSMFSGATSFNQSLANLNITKLQATGSEYVGAGNILDETALSIDNYDATIKGWSAQDVATGLTIGVNSLKYCQAEPERTVLINTKRVRFVGDSKDCTKFQPTDVTFNGNTSIVENTTPGTELGPLSTTAPTHAEGGYAYSLCGGAQDNYVTIDGDKIKLAQSPDFETIQSLSVCVRTTNKLGQTLDRTLSFTITNLFVLAYDANGADGGATPAPSEAYAPGSNATVAGNIGSLTKTGFIFDGWATQANGGTIQAPGSSLVMNADTTLFAKWKDATPPAVPASVPDMTATTDSGESDADNVTNNNNPEFVVVCTEVGSTIKLYLDGVVAETVSCTTPGSTTVRLGDLADKDYALTYTETDSLGNESQHSSVLNFTIDTIPPSTPQITIDPISIDDAINPSEDGGMQTITGTVAGAKSGDIVTVTVNGVHHQVILAGNRFTLDILGSVLVNSLDKRVIVSITVTDVAGNSVTSTAERSYIVGASKSNNNTQHLAETGGSAWVAAVLGAAMTVGGMAEIGRAHV